MRVATIDVLSYNMYIIIISIISNERPQYVIFIKFLVNYFITSKVEANFVEFSSTIQERGNKYYILNVMGMLSNKQG